ncbi:hypothetical protein A2U01_0077300, partial [Trifolium medium]|nr:hypothetical protein [Trifolium medium]
MASSSSIPETSSSVHDENPLNPLDLPPIATLGRSLILAGNTMKFNYELLKIHPEKMI